MRRYLSDVESNLVELLVAFGMRPDFLSETKMNFGGTNLIMNHDIPSNDACFYFLYSTIYTKEWCLTFKTYRRQSGTLDYIDEAYLDGSEEKFLRDITYAKMQLPD